MRGGSGSSSHQYRPPRPCPLRGVRTRRWFPFTLPVALAVVRLQWQAHKGGSDVTDRTALSRRQWLRTTSAGLGALAASPGLASAVGLPQTPPAAAQKPVEPDAVRADRVRRM